MTENGGSAQKYLRDVVGDLSEQTSLLVREEIELAKTEIAEKAKSLGKGTAVAIVAGVMAVFALIYFFEALSWFFNDLFDTVNTSPWIGFMITFGILILLAAIAGF